jgi:DNA-binding transcriptional ArsR family regulator
MLAGCRSRSGADRSLSTHILDGIIRNVAEPAPALIPLFRSEAQLRLLAELFSGTDEEASIHELVDRTGIPQATVSRELSRLELHGLVTSRRVGNTRLVRANWDLPWATELRSILAQTVGVLDHLATALSRVDGIQEAWIYGSWAARYRGEPGPFPRDVDVLIVGDPDRRGLMRAAREVENQLRVDVNTIVVEPAVWGSPDPDSFYAQVRSDPRVAVPLRDDR